MTPAMSALLNALLDIYACTEYARTRSIKVCATGDGAVCLCRNHHRLHPDRPFAAAAAVGPGRHVGGVDLLVYKDTLLSFVASVQLTSNDMLRVGDWIEMPQVGADGDVVDITLHTVKVR